MSIAPGFLGGFDVKGSGLNGATVATVDGIGVTVKSLTVLSPTKLRLRVAVDATAQPGQRTLAVSLPGGRRSPAPSPSARGRTSSRLAWCTARSCLGRCSRHPGAGGNDLGVEQG